MGRMKAMKPEGTGEQGGGGRKEEWSWRTRRKAKTQE